MPAVDPQQAALWALFAAAIALVLALRLVTRRRRRAPPDPHLAVDRRALRRARLIFLLAAAGLALVLITAIRRLLW